MRPRIRGRRTRNGREMSSLDFLCMALLFPAVILGAVVLAAPLAKYDQHQKYYLQARSFGLGIADSKHYTSACESALYERTIHLRAFGDDGRAPRVPTLEEWLNQRNELALPTPHR